MMYIKDNIRYSENKLKRMQVVEPLLSGFYELKMSAKPAITSSEKVIDGGNEQINGVWYIKWIAVDLSEEELSIKVEALKEVKIQELYSSTNLKLETLSEGYPARETDTWTFQLEEAKMYVSDNTASTPFLQSALIGGETVDYYASLVIANNAAWSTYAGSIIGFKREQELAINNATDINFLEGLNYE